MKRLGWKLAFLNFALAVIATGCGKPNSEPPTTENTTGQPGQAVAAAPAPAKQVPADATPDQVVAVFFDAMRAGDVATTEALLTSKASVETKKYDMQVAPTAAPNAQFEVAPAQYLQNNPNGAHVQARWVESDGKQTVTNEVIWVLRKQADGWRIAGMAMELIPGQPPQFLNFEDPADMMNKQQEAMAAFEAQAAAQAASVRQATQPAPSTETKIK